MEEKIINLKELEKFAPKLKGKRVLVGGCFDILHIGHIKYLKAAKKEGDSLIIALESDEFIKKRKNKTPFHNIVERAEILASLDFVDLIIILPYFTKSDDYLNLVTTIKPDIIAISQGDLKEDNKKNQAKKIGAKLKIVTPYIPNKASSLIDINKSN